MKSVQSRNCSRFTELPGRAAVHQLVAQRVDARQHDRQHRHGVEPAERRLRGVVGRSERALEVVLCDRPALRFPELREHVAVVEQHADAAAELGPHQPVEALVPFVELGELVEERAERLLLRLVVALVDLGRVGGVERDPQVDELAVEVAAAASCSAPCSQESARCTRSAERLGPPVALGALAFLESLNSMW